MNLKKKKIRLYHSKKSRINSKNGMGFLDYFIVLDLALLTVLLLTPTAFSFYMNGAVPGNTQNINGFTIKTVPESDWSRENSIGFTYEAVKNDIFIKSGRSIDSMVSTCVHEQLHNLIPNSFNDTIEHRFIYEIDDDFSTVTCEKYRSNLEEIQS